MLHIDLRSRSRARAVNEICDWIRIGTSAQSDDEMADGLVLNVAGSREGNASGIELLVMQIMVDVIRELNPEQAGVYPLA